MCFWMTCKSRIFVTHQIHSKFATVWTATLKITSCNFFHLFFFLFSMSLHYLLILLALCSCAFHCKKTHTYYILLNHTSALPCGENRGLRKSFFMCPSSDLHWSFTEKWRSLHIFGINPECLMQYLILWWPPARTPINLKINRIMEIWNSTQVSNSISCIKIYFCWNNINNNSNAILWI